MVKSIKKKIIISLLVLILSLGFFQLVQGVTKGIGQTATINVSCSDSDGNLSQCNVTSPCTQNCAASGYSGSCSCEFTCTTEGTYDACGQAVDSQGLVDEQCLDTVVCSNLPPDKPGIPAEYPEGESWSHCLFQEISLPTFYWTYSDPDGDPQTAYEIRIDNDSDFSVVDGDEYQCDGAICSGGASTAYTPIPADWSDWMAWNTNYWWIVRVKDDHENWSEWSDPNNFLTPIHAYPHPDFTHQPQFPAAEEEVLFTDTSTCYNITGNSYSCKNNVNNRYQWDFEDDGIIDCDSNINPACRGDATTSYSTAGDYTVRLYITNDIGTCDGTGDTPISAARPLPEYREVPPIIWLKKIFAGIIDFLNGFFKLSNG
jgi:hypothetical protein